MKTESNGGDCSAVAAPASNGGRRRHELVPKLQLSPGHHFVVSDEELVDFYLRGEIEQRRPPRRPWTSSTRLTLLVSIQSN
uniref:NAC domain-containing protein n=1 Tax=Oryza nivara TaxID=4536 RepID=A0A0E0HD65_ORYNI